MKLQIKEYKHVKIKRYFKKGNTFLICNGTNIKNQVKMNQKLKNLGLEYYKMYNSLTKKALNKSIYKNFVPLINSLTIILKPSNDNTDLTLKKLLKLDSSLKLIGIKIHNKIYSVAIINASSELNYKNNNLIFLKLLKTCLKVSCKIVV